MASRTLQVSEKDIRQESRIVWPSFDDCKGRNYSKGNKLFLKVSGLAGAVMTRLQRKSKGQRKKTQNDSAGLFTADLSALTRKEWGDALAQSWRCGIFADCGGGHRQAHLLSKGAAGNPATPLIRISPSSRRYLQGHIQPESPWSWHNRHL